MAARVKHVMVYNGGSGYSSAPTVSFSGASGQTVAATATATISGGIVTSVTITNPGNFSSPPTTVSFSGGGGSGAAANVFGEADRYAYMMENNLLQFVSDSDWQIFPFVTRVCGFYEEEPWREALAFIGIEPTLRPQNPFQTRTPGATDL